MDTTKGASALHRPDWVATVNSEGALLDIPALVPLDENSLILAATENTGLTDFGDDDWREPFQVFLSSLNREANLNMVGRLLTRSDIVTILEGRLRVEELYRRHPEIEDVRIEKPFWIFGQGRTGTSILQTLLGLDPANRVPRMWEAMFPVPAPGVPDRRREIAEARLTQWNRVVPELESMHEFAADAQTETVQFEALSFRSPAWLNLLGFTPSFSAYIAGQDYTHALRYALRVFKAMEWQDSGRTWVLKSPISLAFVPQVLSVFPDARLVWPHRDPIKSLASVLNFIRALDWLRSDHRRGEGTYDQLIEPRGIAAALDQPIAWLQDGAIPQCQLCNVLYLDIVSDPAAVLRSIYSKFDIPRSQAAEAMLDAYVAANPRAARQSHSYSAGSQAEVDTQRALFRHYQDHFSVPSEV